MTDDGILLETNSRHQKIPVASSIGSPLLIPNVKEQLANNNAETPLIAQTISVFRTEAERYDYLRLNRSDFAFAAK